MIPVAVDAPCVLAVESRIDGRADPPVVARTLERLTGRFRVQRLVIDPLSTPWHSPCAAHHFRNGCGPVQAQDAAVQLLRDPRAADAVLIEGHDNLRSGYPDVAERRRLMAIYGPQFPLPEAYTQLAREFMQRAGLSSAQFIQLRDLLYENYAVTARRLGHYRAPEPRWFEPVTSLFRGIDCANPYLDFSGRVLLGTSRVAGALQRATASCVRVAATAVELSGADGPASIGRIAGYEHLARAYHQACAASGIVFDRLFRTGRALLEVYTCYPVVPLGFLRATGLAGDFDRMRQVLQTRELTVTGGMNIARAPWNNPALRGLIAMVRALEQGPQTVGLVHGNGGLGYAQGVAVLVGGA